MAHAQNRTALPLALLDQGLSHSFDQDCPSGPVSLERVCPTQPWGTVPCFLSSPHTDRRPLCRWGVSCHAPQPTGHWLCVSHGGLSFELIKGQNSVATTKLALAESVCPYAPSL